MDDLALRLGFVGEYWEWSLDSVVRYGARRTALGLLGFGGEVCEWIIWRGGWLGVDPSF